MKRFTTGICGQAACNGDLATATQDDMPSRGTNQAAAICELFAALMKAPRTRNELSEMTGLVNQSVCRWLREMRESGLVEFVGLRRDNALGKEAEVYELNPYPFTQRERPYAGPPKRVYIAGPMTGLPDLNFPAFHEAELQLAGHGLEVLNPATLNAGLDGDWAACMRNDIRHLVACDTVALLPGWERSRGARVEQRLARDLGLRVAGLDVLLASLHAERA